MSRHDNNTKIMLQVFSRNWRSSLPGCLRGSWCQDKSRVYYLSIIIETDWLQILIMYFITYWIQYTHTHVYLFHIYAHVCTRVKETMLIPCILLGAHHILASQAHCDSSVVEVPHLELGRNVMKRMTCTLTLTLTMTLTLTLTLTLKTITMMVMNVMMIPPSSKFLI